MASSPVHPLPTPEQAAVLRKAAWRLIPFLCLLYFFNILDRGNVGFARLTMQKSLGLSDADFDFGYGIFYLGYLLFEVPANLLMVRFGARVWMARIMMTWGIVSCLTMTVTDVTGFYAVRILLGIAEAGFFPGIILYLTYWFPPRERAKMTAYFMLAISVSGMIGNQISGAIMHYFNGAAGLEDWQWLFLLEGLPSVVLGVCVLFYLPDGPADARWLSESEKTLLVEQLPRDLQSAQRHSGDWVGALKDPRVWLFIGIYFTVAVGANASGAYLPRLVKERFADANKLEIGRLTALPHLCAIVCMTLLAARSDRTGERALHASFAAFLAAAGWTITAVMPSPMFALAGLCLAQAGMMAMLPVFWTIPPTVLKGTAAAGGIALINSVANLGGLYGPTILGKFGLLSVAIIMFAGGILVQFVNREPERE